MDVYDYIRLVICGIAGSSCAMFIPRPIKTPTLDDMTVILWVVVLIFVGFGMVCFFYAFLAPPEEASKLFWGGLKSIGIGAGICLVRKYFSSY